MYAYLEAELDKLKTRLIKMGTLVEEQIEFAIKTIFEENLELGKIVIDRDDKIDKFDIKIDKLCQKIFAIGQPVATDLRLLMSSLSINKDLERMGDIAVSIVERAEHLAGHTDLLKKIRLEEMSQKVLVMINKTINSFINNDPDLALEIIKSDAVIDEMDREIFNMIINEMIENPSLIKPGAHTLLLLRYLERLADHSTNISEEVIFLVNANIIKHRKKLDEYLQKHAPELLSGTQTDSEKTEGQPNLPVT